MSIIKGYNQKQLTKRIQAVINMHQTEPVYPHNEETICAFNDDSQNRKRMRSVIDEDKQPNKKQKTCPPAFTPPASVLSVLKGALSDIQHAKSRKRSFASINESNSNGDKEEEEPQSKRRRGTLSAYSSREATPQQLQADSIPRRQFRPNRIKESSNVVSSCCQISNLVQIKKRYLKVYEERLRRVYSKYNMGNEKKVNVWLATFGGDVDKLHEIYRRICKKYDLFPCAKYEGYVDEEKKEAEVLRYVKPIPIQAHAASIPSLPDTEEKVQTQNLSADPIDPIDPIAKANVFINDSDNESHDSQITEFSQSTFCGEKSLSLPVFLPTTDQPQELQLFNSDMTDMQMDCDWITNKEDKLFEIPAICDNNNNNRMQMQMNNNNNNLQNPSDAFNYNNHFVPDNESFFTSPKIPKKKKGRRRRRH